MAKKQVQIKIKLQIPAGGATPAPPVGPALGQQGVNIMEFCKAFNEATKNREAGMIVPVVISVYVDKSFTFETKVAPVSSLLKKAAGIAVASATPNKEKVGNVTEEQVREIAKEKLTDLNTNDIEAAINMVKGTARSMGINISSQPVEKKDDKPESEKVEDEK